MELRDNTDHIAILALTMVGVLTKRLRDLGDLDPATSHQLQKLARGVRLHASHAGLDDLKILFDNIDRALEEPVAA